MSIEIIKSRTNGVWFWFLGERVLAAASVILITEMLTIKEPVFIRIIFHLLIQKTFDPRVCFKITKPVKVTAAIRKIETILSANEKIR